MTVDEWYYGHHEQVLSSDAQTGHETVRALSLPRPWHDGE